MTLTSLIVLAALQAPPTVDLDEKATFVQGRWAYYEDATGDRSLEEILEAQPSFVNYHEPTQPPNWGFTTSVYWFRTQLTNRQDVDRFVLSLEYPVLDYVTAYIIEPSTQSVESSFAVGDRLRFDERHVAQRFPNGLLPIEPGATRDVLMRVETYGSMQVPVGIYTEAGFIEAAVRDTAGLWTYYGLMTFAFILNLLFYLAIRDKVYLSYLFYLGSYLLFQLSLNGVLFERVFPNHPDIPNSALALFGCLLGFGVARFTAQFNSTKELSPKINIVLNALQVIAILSVVAQVAISYRHSLMIVTLFGAVTPIACLSAGLTSWKGGYRPAKFFTAAWIVFILGMLTFVLKTAGIFPTNFATQYAMQIGSALEAIFLTVALGDRLRLALEEKELLTQKVNKQTAALAEQSQKRAEAEERLRVELETKVEILSDAVHHINNPLNHIQGANEIVKQDVGELHDALRLAIPDVPNDPDYVAFTSALDANVANVKDATKLSNDAVERAAQAVSDIRTLTNIDGLALQPIRVTELFKRLEERFTLTPAVTFTPPEPHIKAIGNPTIYSFVIGTAVQTLQRLLGPDTPVVMHAHQSPSSKDATLQITFDSNEALTQQERHVIDDTLSRLTYLLGNLGSSIVREGTVFVVPLSNQVSRSPAKAIEKSSESQLSRASGNEEGG